MDSNTTTELKAKAKRGIRMLIARQALIQCLNFAAAVVLARLLDPAEFGVFFVASFVVGTITSFTDFGFGAALIQQQADISEKELNVVFTVQQVVLGGFSVGLLLLAPYIASRMLKDMVQLTMLLRLLAVTLWLSAWRSVNVLQIERSLEHSRLASIEIAESAVYQVLAVLLAWLKLGVYALGVAAVVRMALGTWLTFCAVPWRMRLAYDRATVTRLLRFGVPFQLQSLAVNISSWLTPTVVGSVLGSSAVGLVTWASSNGRRPMLVVDAIMRVAYPHLCRLQSDPQEVRRTVSQYVQQVLLVGGLWAVFIVVLGDPVVRLVYGSKWLAGVSSLQIFAFCVPTEAIIWILASLLASGGYVDKSSLLNFVKNVLFLVLGWYLVPRVGLVAVPIAQVVTSAGVLPLFVFSKQMSGMAEVVLKPLGKLALCVVGTIGVALSVFGPTARSGDLVWIVLEGIAVFGLYVALTAVAFPVVYQTIRLRLRGALCG